jgi:hypothetical protein
VKSISFFFGEYCVGALKAIERLLCLYLLLRFNNTSIVIVHRAWRGNHPAAETTTAHHRHILLLRHPTYVKSSQLGLYVCLHSRPKLPDSFLGLGLLLGALLA